jgi:hypothetical protein
MISRCAQQNAPNAWDFRVRVATPDLWRDTEQVECFSEFLDEQARRGSPIRSPPRIDRVDVCLRFRRRR